MTITFEENTLENGNTQIIGIFTDDEGIEKTFKSTSNRTFDDDWKNEIILSFVDESETGSVEQI